MFAFAIAGSPGVAQQLRVTDGQHLELDGLDVRAHTGIDINGEYITGPAVWVMDGSLTVTNSQIDFLNAAGEALHIHDDGSGNPSIVKLYGTIEKVGRLSAMGALGDAVFVSGNNSELYLDRIHIQATGNERYGIFVNGDSALSTSYSTILADGYGIKIVGTPEFYGATAYIENTNINTNTRSGATIVNGTLVARNFSISAGEDAKFKPSLEANNAYGLALFEINNAELSDGRIETWGTGGGGIFARSSQIDDTLTLNNLSIVTHERDAPAVTVDFVSTEVNGGKLHTYGARSAGAQFSGRDKEGEYERIVISGTEIITEEESSMGLIAADFVTLSGSGLSITTMGHNAHGTYSHGTGRMSLANRTSIKTYGSNAHGAVAAYGSHMEVTDTKIETFGDHAAGLNLMSLNLPSYGPVLEQETKMAVVNSSITVSRGPAILVAGGKNNYLKLSKSHLNAREPNSFLFRSEPFVIDGISDDHLTSEVGTADIFAEGSLLEGDILVSSGTVNFDLRDGSLLKGAARANDTGKMLDRLSIDGTSTWDITNSSIVNLLYSAGTISLASPDENGFKTLTVTGDFTSDDSLFVLNSELGDDDSKTDRLVFEGAVAGVSRLSVNNVGGMGALTTGNGIRVVDAALATSDAFVQQGRISAGAYDYTLFAGDRSGNFDGRWYLRSTYHPTPNPDPKPELELPDYRSEVPLDMVAPVLMNRFGLAMLSTYHDRRDTIDSNVSAFWFRAFGEHGNAGSASGSAENHLADFYRDGASYSYTLGGFQTGMDLYRSEKPNGTQDLAGLFVGAGRAEADVDRVYGGKAGELTMNGYSFGGYWTHLDQAGWYSDAVVQGTRYDQVHSKSIEDIGMLTAGWGLISSIEGGYRHALSDGWTVEPQAQLIYQHVSLDNTSDQFSRISFANNDTVYGRVGAKVGRDWQTEDSRRFSAWARVNIWHTMGNEARTSFANFEGNNRVTLGSDLGGTWGQVDLGFSGQLTKQVSLFASGSFSHSLGHNGTKSDSISGRVGLDVQW